MSIWTYKVITSGKGGFATPALLETFLNQLGTDGWEIIHFQTPQDNALAFTGLARRSSQRDWTLEDAAAAAAKVEGDKLRAEFEAKFRGGAAAGTDDKTDTTAGDGAASDDGLRRLRDTEARSRLRRAGRGRGAGRVGRAGQGGRIADFLRGHPAADAAKPARRGAFRGCRPPGQEVGDERGRCRRSPEGMRFFDSGR